MTRRQSAHRHSSHLSVPWLIWRQASANLGGSITVAAIVLVMAALATGVPRAINNMFTDGLQLAVAQLPATQRDLVGAARGGPLSGPASRPGASGLSPELEAVWGLQEDSITSVQAEMPQALAAAVDPARYVVTLPPLGASPADPSIKKPATELSLGFDPHLAERIDIVEGKAPVAFASALPTDAAVELLLSAASAESMAWAVGDERVMGLPNGGQQVLRLSGTFDAADKNSTYWKHVPGALEPSVLSAGRLEPTYTGVAYLDPASWAVAGELSSNFINQVWFPVEAAELSSSGATDFAQSLRTFTRLPHAMASTEGTTGYVGDSGMSFSTKLGLTLQDVFVRTSVTSAVLAMAASGPIGVVLAVLVLGARLIGHRRSTGLGLAAARGATTGQLRGVLAIEGAVIGIPAATVGTAIGLLVVSGQATPATFILPALVAIGPAILLALSTSEKSLRRFRSDLGVGTASRSRWVLEVLVLGVAAVSVVLLTQRGLTTSSDSIGVDPLLAATPLLLSLAACVVVMRVYPAPLRWLSERLKARPGLTNFLGSARAVRDPAAGFAPILPLVVGVSVAVFGAGMLATVQSGVETAARSEVGADLRVSAPHLTKEQLAAIIDVSGVAALAPVYARVAANLSIDGHRPDTVSVIVVDAAELRAVQAGGAGALDLPESLSAPAGDTVPVVLSDILAAEIEEGSSIELGDEKLDVVATGASEIPLTPKQSWVIVDRANADALVSSTFSPEIALVDLDDGADPALVSAGIRSAAGDGAEVVLPADLAEAVNSTPSVQGLRIALVLAIALAWLLTAVTVVMTLVLISPARDRILALLGALGLERSTKRALVGWEIGPLAVAALVAGTLLGTGLPFIVLAGVDLRPFTEGVVQPAVTQSPLLLALVLGGFLLVVVAGSAIALLTARRADAAGTLRTIEEG
ncbi:FtsX-like permease family protein [Glaciibacter superstes]|uniref:FtsX-like permease family protein n=1 Tax=Glaciibacter superstes TaxID=501023 RepID=UPI0003B70ED7|nr:FtsX-like permease family protein [Glaciibacter superstes]